jgi:hypothetical protein
MIYHATRIFILTLSTWYISLVFDYVWAGTSALLQNNAKQARSNRPNVPVIESSMFIYRWALTYLVCFVFFMPYCVSQFFILFSLSMSKQSIRTTQYDLRIKMCLETKYHIFFSLELFYMIQAHFSIKIILSSSNRLFELQK